MVLIYSDGKGKTANILEEWGKGYADKRGLSFTAFPEGTFHPEKQRKLFDMLLLDSEVVVTHSEFILLRYMQLIRTGKMEPQTAVTVLQLCESVNKPENIAHFREVQFDEEGDPIDHWNGGFFETGYEMRFDLDKE